MDINEQLEKLNKLYNELSSEKIAIIDNNLDDESIVQNNIEPYIEEKGLLKCQQLTKLI